MKNSKHYDTSDETERDNKGEGVIETTQYDNVPTNLSNQLIEKKSSSQTSVSNKSKKILGTGLDALLGPNIGVHEHQKIVDLNISNIGPSTHQPRTIFNQEELKQLSLSLKKHGLIQPIIVRKKPNSNTFTLIAGERRWRAAQLLKWTTIPTIIKESNDNDTYAIAIVENIQRSNLTPLEEANAYQNLILQGAYTQDDMAKIMGKSRSYIANTLRLLNLSIKCQEHLNSKIITFGHAKALLSFDNKNMDDLLEHVLQHQLNVRQTEKLASIVAANMADGLSFQETILQTHINKNTSNKSTIEKTKKRKQTEFSNKEKDNLQGDIQSNPGTTILPTQWQSIISNHQISEDIMQIEKNLTDTLKLQTKVCVKGGEGLVMIHFDSFDKLDYLISFLDKK